MEEEGEDRDDNEIIQRTQLNDDSDASDDQSEDEMEGDYVENFVSCYLNLHLKN